MNNDKREAEEDVESVEPGDSASDVESKILGLDNLTGVPSEIAEDTKEVPGP